ncbi:MAG: diguanylate cyclase, partial [Betaproteobacteria bacterium]
MSDALPLLRTLAGILDSLDVAVCVLDDADHTLIWNRAFLQYFPEHAGHIHEHEPYRASLRRFYEVCLGAGEMPAIEHRIDEDLAGLRTQDRPHELEHRGLRLRVASLPWPGVGRIRIWTSIAARAPDQRELAAQLLQVELRANETEALLNLTLERMEQGIMLMNAERQVLVCNRRAIELLGLPEELMASRPSFDAVLAWQISQDEFAHTPLEIQDFIRSGRILDRPNSYDRKRPDGRVIEVLTVPIGAGGALRTYTDITERKRIEERIRQVSRQDSLTALVNREVFLEYLEAAVAASVGGGEAFAVHFIDLDRFKPINDSFGHAVGDKVLALVANRMREIAREADVVARMGGDEFAVLQYGVVRIDRALGLARRILAGVALPMDIEAHRLQVGASIGIAHYPADGSDPDTLLRNADAAMYAGKATGGDCVRTFE